MGIYEETGFVCRELNRLGKGRIMMNRYNSHAYAFYGTGAVKLAGFREERDCEVVLVTCAKFKALVLSGQFEQFPSFALLVLADWKFGSGFLGQPC